jgi:hypothetical protein
VATAIYHIFRRQGPALVAVADPPIEGPTIGLGLEEDLSNLRGTGAITYKNFGWQIAGLTKVDYARMVYESRYLETALKEAAANASAIRFDVTSFVPGLVRNGFTQAEFDLIIRNEVFLAKTVFIRAGQEVWWNGKEFIKKL